MHRPRRRAHWMSSEMDLRPKLFYYNIRKTRASNSCESTLLVRKIRLSDFDPVLSEFSIGSVSASPDGKVALNVDFVLRKESWL